VGSLITTTRERIVLLSTTSETMVGVGTTTIAEIKKGSSASGL